ncbi:MAG: hypothetical protein J5585_01590 [Clostridia bacterium]|nr:hypothetical protein [Clostridia bacterium]
MPTFATARMKCAVCGKESAHRVIYSTNCFGSSDLDTRPPEMKRSTMDFWVQECPKCGFVSGRIDDSTSITPEFLESSSYKTCDELSFNSKLASRFYRQYMIKAYENNEREAFFALLHAAWACDDMNDTENAAYCRRAS